MYIYAKMSDVLSINRAKMETMRPPPTYHPLTHSFTNIWHKVSIRWIGFILYLNNLISLIFQMQHLLCLVNIIILLNSNKIKSGFYSPELRVQVWLFSVVCLLSVRLLIFHLFIFSRISGSISTNLDTKHPWSNDKQSEIAKMRWRHSEIFCTTTRPILSKVGTLHA